MSTAPRRALIVIDIQNEYFGDKFPIEFPPPKLSLALACKAMDAATAANIPVVLVQNVAAETSPIFAKGSAGAALHASVESRHADHRVMKALPSAFAGTGLEEWLRERQIDTIAIAGYMTHNCNFSTVVQAMHAGFAVEYLSDASGSLPYANSAGSATAEEIHRVFTVVMQSRFAAVLRTEEWISLINTGGQPERDNIYKSNQRARSL